MRSFKISLILATLAISALLLGACTNSSVQEKAKKEEVKEKVNKKEAEKQKEEKNTEIAVGNPSPAFELTTTDNKKISLNDLKGNPSILVFWASYCGKCRKETPQINRLVKDFEPKGVNIVGVNLGETDEKLKEGVESFGIEYTVAKDSDKAVANKLDVKGTPTIIFLDKEGKIEFIGNKLPEDYDKRLNTMMS